MNMSKKIASLCILTWFLALPVMAQEYLISAGNADACIGALLDSGGNPSNYGNNENYTATICPDQPDGAISLQWIIFELSGQGTAPMDQISIYDGNSTSEPLIGTWTGNGSPGIVSASFANTSGCLTVVFTSNAIGTGNFAAAISCYEPCEPPTASAVMNEPVPALVCQGELIQFDASASTAADGFSIAQYIWDFADGSQDSTSGAIVEHAFDIPGEYVVQVTVIDDNECSSINLVDLQVLVSTTPLFTGTTPDTVICQGETVLLNGEATAVQWSALPESNLGEGIFLPDLQGVPFSTTLSFNNFSPGQTLVDPNDLESVCVSMEHSYMGDLVISLTCPSGQSVVFHQQGGGGTYIGVPVDDESLTPGECWEYCWSPTATNGTWANNSGGTLPSGTYGTVQPWSNLQGCPLNGVWTFTVVDLFAIDNGYLCDWEMNFNPSLFPSLTEYTPVLGLTTPDSASWSGAAFTPDPSDPTMGVAAPSQPGTYDYVFSVTDDFGCTYDTTITITVLPSPQGPILITGNSTICDGSVAFLNAPPGFDSYVWSNGAVGPNISVIDPGTYTVTVGLGNCTLPSEPFPVDIAPSPVPVITGPQFSCGGGVVLGTTETYASYSWSTGATTPTITVGSGTYGLTVTTAAGCTGIAAPYTVLVGNEPTAAFSTDPVSPQDPGVTVNFFDQSSGNGSTITDWDWTFGIIGEGSSAQNPSFTYNIPDTYWITLIVTTSEGCTDTTYQSYVIRPEDIIIPNVFSPNNDGLNDFFVVENLQYYKNSLTIYNRWGMVVYETVNYRNTWKATDVPDGTYYYLIRVSETGREYAGHLTILR